MFAPLRQMFRSKPAPPKAAVPPGKRYYAIGDIHGRLDLFEALVEAIERDDAEREPAATTVVLLGDLVDRGPQSAGVVDRALRWSEARDVRLLAGNHEEMFLDSFEHTSVFKHFLRHGGRETVLSYGIPRKVYDGVALEELQALLAAKVPARHRAFLAGASNYHVAGDYLLVHAGIMPNVPLEQQTSHHMRWIRDPFLAHEGPHDYVVIHGHTITEEVDERPNRIGIDTGAYHSGRLTAMALEGGTRRLIQAVAGERGIYIQHGANAG